MAFLETGWFLLFMVVMGVVTHWLKQVVMMRTSRPAGLGPVGFKTYWIEHWPETLMAVTSAAAAVALLYEIEHLTAASAWGAGYLGNSAADMLGGRVQAMINAAAITRPPDAKP